LEKIFEIEDFQVSSKLITFRADGINYMFKLSEISPRLAKASEDERNDYTISPSGYGVHWGSIDEDISFEGLIQKT
jgi:hypothetical protein